MFFSSDERKWITKIMKLKEKFPDLVTILAAPEENDGCIYAKLPADWLKIQPKRATTLSDDQIVALKERLLIARKTHRTSEEMKGVKL